jgi:hypothetical protein
MTRLRTWTTIGAPIVAAAIATAVACSSGSSDNSPAPITPPPAQASPQATNDGACPPSGTSDFGNSALVEGQKTFRFDTFGDEAYWGDTLKIHQAIEGQAHGGVGAGVSPKAGLALGVKIDAAAIPPDVVAAIKANQVNLDDPATTLKLLQLNAVVGLTGFFDSNGALQSIGVQCALCHSTVDDSFSPGIGNRLDGWPNRDLNVGALISLSPDLSSLATFLGVDDATVRKVLASWGPGKYDNELLLDGKAVRPDGKPAATLIPPAFGLAGVNLHTYTGWGSVPYWNAFVAVLQMHGKGTFFDPRLDDATQFPLAAKNKLGHIRVDENQDRVTSKLPGLHAYQLSLAAPKPPTGSFDAASADRGHTLFGGKAQCANCHTQPILTEPGWNLHAPAEIGIDDFQANRAPDKRYRTTPLHGLFTHTKGGFYHDGRFATLLDVVNHYDQQFALGLSDQEKQDLVAYMMAQ